MSERGEWTNIVRFFTNIENCKMRSYCDVFVYVLSVLRYGCLVQWHAMESRSLIPQFTTIQRVVFLLTTAVLKITPQSALILVLNFQPLDLLFQFLPRRNGKRTTQQHNNTIVRQPIKLSSPVPLNQEPFLNEVSHL